MQEQEPGLVPVPGQKDVKTVVWTDEGEARQALSEHGRHKSGDEVETVHADILIRRGFAK